MVVVTVIAIVADGDGGKVVVVVVVDIKVPVSKKQQILRSVAVAVAVAVAVGLLLLLSRQLHLWQLMLPQMRLLLLSAAAVVFDDTADRVQPRGLPKKIQNSSTHSILEVVLHSSRSCWGLLAPNTWRVNIDYHYHFYIHTHNLDTLELSRLSEAPPCL